MKIDGKKFCIKCGLEKCLNDFYFRKDNNKHQNTCKECNSILSKLYIEKNKEKIRIRRKKYFQDNKEKFREKKRKYRKENPEKYKESTRKYYLKSKDIQFKKKKEYIEKNRKVYNEYFKTMKSNNPSYKITCNLRSRIWSILKRKDIKKTNKTIDLIGCTSQELKEHIEKQFINGMTWENYGQFG